MLAIGRATMWQLGISSDCRSAATSYSKYLACRWWAPISAGSEVKYWVNLENTNEELCSRWMQVGSFYPFARNHHENESISQEPYQFGNKLLETSKMSFYQRYSLLKQMYSTLVELNGTGTFYRPLFFEFPKDKQCYAEKFAET